ncbi:MAG: glycine cleavage system aminomethyltransferase GcvT [Candidatus Brockarchaeota archaeon]|nr:glycine cleavage system aminomethyltransferase GcvT [Candidatus Brockarchaeota archaeon]
MARKAHLHELHAAASAKMVEFAGGEMPLWVSSISEEHLAVRNGVGIFDVSHMGEIVVTGNEASRFLNYLSTNDVSKLGGCSGQYSTVCNHAGGIKDDVLIYSLEGRGYMVVTNAANTEKILGWFRSFQDEFDVEVEDATLSTAMFAVQGPKALETLQRIAPFDLQGLRRFGGKISFLSGQEVLLSRTGYTGEDGFEIYLMGVAIDEPGKAIDLWNAIIEAGKGFGIKPCGLGARDTLRLEAGLPLYGNDIGEDVTPLEARLDFVVKFEKDFVGKEALAAQKESGLESVRVGFELLDRAVPRHGNPILKDGKQVGRVTSGTVSPLSRKPIGMGYVPPRYSPVGTELEVEIRGSLHRMRVADWPFYDTARYGRNRAK